MDEERNPVKKESSGLGAGVRRRLIAGVAMPLGSKALTSIADRLERAEGRRSVMSRGLRAASKLARHDKNAARRGGPGAPDAQLGTPRKS